MQEKERHMFVIPTHRECAKAVKSILCEIEAIKEKDYDNFLVIIDNSEKDIYERNHAFLEKVRKEIDYKVYHIGTLALEKLTEMIGKNLQIDPEELKDLLIPIRTDYGKMFNWIYISSILLNATVIHRRDSDCFVEGIKKEYYPIKEEIEYIGKNINSKLDTIEIRKQDTFNDKEKICIVGSDYAGNWNLDLHELKEHDPDVIRKVLRLSNISVEDIEEIKKDYTTMAYNEVDECPVLKNTFDFEYNTMPECGNLSMREVYRYIPNFIGEFGIGYDYFTYFICFLYKIPIVFHKHRIMHVHDDRRYQSIQLLNYWMGMYKNLVLDMIYTDLIAQNSIEKICGKQKGIDALKATSRKELPNVLKESIEKLKLEDEERIINILCRDILMFSPLEHYQKIGKDLFDNKEKMILETRNDFKKSIHLIEIWNDIVESLDAIDLEKYL